MTEAIREMFTRFMADGYYRAVFAILFVIGIYVGLIIRKSRKGFSPYIRRYK